MKSKPQYQKFSKRSTFSVQTAYLADDHLLVLDGTYAETRRKLAFKDIEAILISPSRGGIIWGLVFGLAAFASFVAVLVNLSEGLYLPVSIVSLLCFGGLAAHFIYGQGSALFGVKTAVQTVVIHGINSRRKANRAMVQLTAIIEGVQGQLTEEALETAHRQAVVIEVPQPTETLASQDAERFALKPKMPDSKDGAEAVP